MIEPARTTVEDALKLARRALRDARCMSCGSSFCWLSEQYRTIKNRPGRLCRLHRQMHDALLAIAPWLKEQDAVDSQAAVAGGAKPTPPYSLELLPEQPKDETL